MLPQKNFERVKLFDPNRRPSDWTGLLSNAQVAVFFSDSKSGTEIDCEGLLVLSEGSCYVFAGCEEAERFCQELVLRIPNARCEIFDKRGRAVEALAEIVHPSAPKNKETDPRRAKLFIAIAIVLTLSCIPLVYLDWVHEEQLIWPTFIAINFFGLSMRLAYWGMGVLHRNKKRLKQHAAVN